MGTNFGIGFGLGFTFGIPLGAALAEVEGPDMPLYLAAFMSIGAGGITFFLPVNDVNSSLIKAEIETKAISSPMHQSVGYTLPAFDIEDKSKTSLKNAPVPVPVPVPTGNVKPSLWSKFMAGRHFPSNYSEFLYKNRPVSGFFLIKLAKNSYDWLSIFCIDVANQIISSTFINFAIEAYGWSTTLAGIVISFVGITIAIGILYNKLFI